MIQIPWILYKSCLIWIRLQVFFSLQVFRESQWKGRVQRRLLRGRLESLDFCPTKGLDLKLHSNAPVWTFLKKVPLVNI